VVEFVEREDKVRKALLGCPHIFKHIFGQFNWVRKDWKYVIWMLRWAFPQVVSCAKEIARPFFRCWRNQSWIRALYPVSSYPHTTHERPHHVKHIYSLYMRTQIYSISSSRFSSSFLALQPTLILHTHTNQKLTDAASHESLQPNYIYLLH
jgi:hypothetical protein